MIHRLFIGPSFSNSAFAFTRRTCIAASKTILKETKTKADRNGPVLWIDQAFAVAAAITLSLDALHRDTHDTLRAEHKALTEETIEYLSQFKRSMIAARGVKLISVLVKEIAADNSSSRKRRRPDSQDDDPRSRGKRTKTFNLSNLMGRISTDMPTTPGITVEATSEDDFGDVFADFFPPQTGFGLDPFFEGLFEV